ncbi:MAG: O-antigen/teichoic acid export membrane protein [Francisellaceae bacterium]|jgi:O-antigen/teichoic acid export membrane protein
MKFNFSLLWAYSSQLYAALIMIIIIPFLVEGLGVEAYGLIAFFNLLQISLNIFEAGIGGTVTRQVVVAKEDYHFFSIVLGQFKIVCLFFIVIASCIFCAGYSFSDYIATYWLDSKLAKPILTDSIVIMFGIFSLRYIQGPFISFLIGLECHKTISITRIIFVSLSAPLSLVILYYSNGNINTYFNYQFIVAGLNLIVVIALFIYHSRIISREINGKRKNVIIKDIKELMGFTFQLSTLSMLWVIASQVDKIALTKYISLEEYAYYSIAISLSAVLLTLITPLVQVLQPRLTSLLSNKCHQDYIRIISTSLIGVLLLSISIATMFAFLGKEIVIIWSGDELLAENVIKYVPWLMGGVSISLIMKFAFMIQYSHGSLGLHTKVYMAYCSLLIPLSVYIAIHFGAQGAAKFFFIQNVIFVSIWGGYVFDKYMDHFVRKIILPVTFSILLCGLGYFYLVSSLFSFPVSARGSSFISIVTFYFIFIGLFALLFYKNKSLLTEKIKLCILKKV